MKQIIPYLLAAILGIALWQQSGTITSLRKERNDAVEEVKVVRSKMAKVQLAATKAQTEATSARLRLKEVLDADPRYRDGRTPEPVVNSLCQTLRCK